MTTQTITAAIFRGGKRFTVEQVAARAAGPDEVSIRVAYCGICGTDLHVFHGNMDQRVGDCRVLGHEMAGTIEAVGASVQGLEIGQRVVVRPLISCGDCPACSAGFAHNCHQLRVVGIDTDGAMQELCTVPALTVHVVPDDVPLDHAALIEPTAVACHDVRLSRLQPGEDVVVVGGGPIGLLIALVARARGGNVLVSEVNEQRLSLAQRMGFDTINPADLDIVQVVNARTGSKGADVVFEVSGTQPGVDAMTAIAATRGRLVMVAIHAQKPQMDLFQVFWRELQLIGARVYEPDDYEAAIELISSGTVDVGRLITDVSPLEEVQSAFEALETDPTAMKSLLKLGDGA